MDPRQWVKGVGGGRLWIHEEAIVRSVIKGNKLESITAHGDKEVLGEEITWIRVNG